MKKLSIILALILVVATGFAPESEVKDIYFKEYCGDWVFDEPGSPYNTAQTRWCYNLAGGTPYGWCKDTRPCPYCAVIRECNNPVPQ